jgi:hypothetical protein
MRAVLEARPELKTATGQAGYCSKEHYGSLLKKLTVPELMILDLFNSTCFPCLSGWCVESMLLVAQVSKPSDCCFPRFAHCSSNGTRRKVARLENINSCALHSPLLPGHSC